MSIDLNKMYYHPTLRPAHPPRGTSQQQQQQPPTETQIQAEPDEEILGSDDEEQEDPNDYCKGGRHGFIRPILTAEVTA